MVNLRVLFLLVSITAPWVFRFRIRLREFRTGIFVHRIVRVVIAVVAVVVAFSIGFVVFFLVTLFLSVTATSGVPPST
jgi:hypothetical protein